MSIKLEPAERERERERRNEEIADGTCNHGYNYTAAVMTNTKIDHRLFQAS